jgi:hypothetical protein
MGVRRDIDSVAGELDQLERLALDFEEQASRAKALSELSTDHLNAFMAELSRRQRTSALRDTMFFLAGAALTLATSIWF